MPWKSALPTFIAGLPQAIDAGVGETAQQVHDTARSLVPVDTGALQTSIEVFGAGGSGERVVSAGQSLDYAVIVEYGSARQAAQPYMTPAAVQHAADLPHNVARHLKDLEKRSKV
jgi:hypothetical protein